MGGAHPIENVLPSPLLGRTSILSARVTRRKVFPCIPRCRNVHDASMMIDWREEMGEREEMEQEKGIH